MNRQIRRLVRTAVLLLISAVLGCVKSENFSEKKVFRYNQSEALTSLDPAFARNQANIRVVCQLFNGLTALNNELRAEPDLAERWEISEDGSVYTFQLRSDVFFHDSEAFKNGKGRRLTAQDVVYSFKRILDPATASPGAWIFNDKVLRDEKGNISDTCFRALDDKTVRIYLQKSFPAFLEILAMPYAFIVPREAVEQYGKDFRAHPVGTGPFKFKLWEEEAALILHKNEKYFKKDEKGRALPYLDAVQVSFIKDANTVFLSFLQGKLHFLSGVFENARETLFDKSGKLKAEFSDRISVQKAPYLNTEYLGFQLDPDKYTDKNHPLLNKKVRQALSYAIDRKALIRYILFGNGTPGTSGMVPKALPSFSAEAVPGYDYDPVKTQVLLREAGYPSGRGLPELTLSTISKYPYKEAAEFFQKQWAAAGIRVKIDINQAGSLLEMVDAGKVSFFRASWLGDYPDAENYLTLFYSKNFTPAGPNKTHFKNAEFDRLYETALRETDTEKRYDLYRRMDRLVTEEAPIIVLFYDEVTRLVRKEVKGLDVNGMNMLKLERVRLE